MKTSRWYRDTSLLLLSLSVDHMLSSKAIRNPLNDSLPHLSSPLFPPNEAIHLQHRKNKECSVRETQIFFEDVEKL